MCQRALSLGPGCVWPWGASGSSQDWLCPSMVETCPAFINTLVKKLAGDPGTLISGDQTGYISCLLDSGLT
jgi:hypothetical protein